MDPLDAVLLMFRRGGPVMWPLLLLSVVSLTLTIERSWFWFRVHGGGLSRWMDEACRALRRGDRVEGERLASRGGVIYGFVLGALSRRVANVASGVELGERARPLIERFSATQSVIVTAAPLLGILGTVLGIIQSFEVLSSSDAVRDVNAVAAGIAEALITTAFGLIVALLTLFPHALFRAQAGRCLGNIERLTAAALQSNDRVDRGGGERAGDGGVAPVPGSVDGGVPEGGGVVTGKPAHRGTTPGRRRPDGRP